MVDAFSRIVRLGAGVSESGRLSDAAMDRTVSALRVCAGKIRKRGVSRFRAVGTEACRRADNCESFLSRARNEANIELEIISPAEEAGLALDGCAPLVEKEARHALLFDIGGGSTELIWVRHDGEDAPRLLNWTSLSHGVVSLAERHGEDRIDRQKFDDMIADVAPRISAFARENHVGDAIAARDVQLLGTSGTVTTIAGVHLDLPRYDRSKVDGIKLSFGDVRAVVDRLVHQDVAARAAEPCIGHDRGDVVLAGCAILEAIMRACPVEQLRVADRGLREGMLMRMMQADGFHFGRTG